MRSLLFKTIVSGSLAIGACGLSMAQPVTFTGFANGYQAITFALNPSSPYQAYTIAAGGFATSYAGASFTSYCADMFQELPAWNTANTSYGEVGAAGFFGTKLDDVAKLFSGVSVSTSLESAAFQLALWEIQYEASGAYDLSTGSAIFKDANLADGDAVALAQTYLNGLSGYGSSMQVHVLASGSNQDVVFATPVPEPSTYALMLVGLTGVGLAARRRKQQG
jgi:hypothetical protein